jgi:hypothetical protein
MKTHFRDIRLRNNAGMDFPLCFASAPLLDLDKGCLSTVADFAKVTCQHCKRMAPKRYPWASFARARGEEK